MTSYSRPYTPLLVGLYFLLIILASYQILLNYYHGHKLMSFNFGFLGLCVMFCVFRVVFWLSDTSTYVSYHLVFWYPINIQFGMFYLLMLYLMRLVRLSEGSWNIKRKKLVFWISLSLNAAFFFATTAWLIFCSSISCVDNNLTCKATNICENTHAIFAALCFLTLGLSLLFYGVKLHIIASREATAREKGAMSGGQNGLQNVTKVRWGPNESRFRTEAICFVLLTVFITRAVFDLVQLDLFNSHPLAVATSTYSKDITNGVVFWMYVVWEIFPTTLMLFFFGTASGSAGPNATQAKFIATITDQVSGKSFLDPTDDDDVDSIERGTSDAFWPFPKEVAEVASQSGVQRSIRGPLQANDQSRPGLMEDDERYDYDSPGDSLYGLSSPLPLNAVSKGYYAAMAQPPTAHPNIMSSNPPFMGASTHVGLPLDTSAAPSRTGPSKPPGLPECD